MRIDAHQHYWEPRRGDYEWMPEGDPVLDRRYGPADLAPALARHGIARTVVVQGAATVEETEYMLGIADATETVAAVVGWVDFEKPDHRRHLERLARHPKLAGIRPMIQDIPDVDWMLRADVQWAYRAVIDLDLTFDALGFPPHLDNFLTIFGRYPDLRVVIDHCMKPRIRDHSAGAFSTSGPGGCPDSRTRPGRSASSPGSSRRPTKTGRRRTCAPTRSTSSPPSVPSG